MRIPPGTIGGGGNAPLADADPLAEVHRGRGNTSVWRPLDRRFDGRWAGLHGRLYGEPECDRAVEVLANLFPDGLQFVTSSFEAQWFHSRMLLERIEREDLS